MVDSQMTLKTLFNTDPLMEIRERIERIEEWIDFWETIETGWRKKCKKKKHK